jgi:DNA-directed RNA polymerase subunit L
MKKIFTDDPNYNRDPSSKALLNTNVQAFEEYKSKKVLQNRINKLEENVSDLNGKVDSILSILTKLVGN